MTNEAGIVAALQVRDAVFSYPRRGSDPGFSLRVRDLRVQAGEQVLIASPSGSGKSTLLHLIAGLLEVSSGSVEVCGQRVHDLRGATRDRFRGRTIGMIFQTFQLLEGFSAEENVAMALSMCEAPGSDHRARSREVLAGLGIDKPGARVEDLSVGQQQRVAVARALVTRPALVLADEPTASLDPHHAGIAIDLIRGACAQSGAALLCVSHDEVVKGRFARRLSMEDVLVREGVPAPAMGAGVAS